MAFITCFSFKMISQICDLTQAMFWQPYLKVTKAQITEAAFPSERNVFISPYRGGRTQCYSMWTLKRNEKNIFNYLALCGIYRYGTILFPIGFLINICAHPSSSACMSILNMLLTIHFLFPIPLRNSMTHMVVKKAIYCTINNPWLF